MITVDGWDSPIYMLCELKKKCRPRYGMVNHFPISPQTHRHTQALAPSDRIHRTRTAAADLAHGHLRGIENAESPEARALAVRTEAVAVRDRRGRGRGVAALGPVAIRALLT